MTRRRDVERRADALAVALHEASHAVVFAALGAPVRRATAVPSLGVVHPDPPRARAMADALRAARGAGPPGPVAEIAAAMALSAIGWAGALGVLQRMRLRRAARWHRAAARAACASRADFGFVLRADARAQAQGLCPWATDAAARAWVDEMLEHHRRHVARIARALLRRGRLEGAELDALLAPVRDDPAPFLRLVAVAARLLSDPDARAPAAAEPGQPAGDGECDAETA